MGTIIYMLIVLLGQLIFAAGGYFGRFWLMIVGRFIFGIGAESLAVAQNSYAVLWFKGKELNMVFGLQLSVGRFGSTVNFWIMQPLYAYVSQTYAGYSAVGVTLFVASTTCVMSLMCTLILGMFWMVFPRNCSYYILFLQVGWTNVPNVYWNATIIPPEK